MEVTQEILREKMRKATVGIAGLGGLGSNVAAALARTGIGRLILVDFDEVEAGNLNRQNYFTEDVGMLKTDALARIIARINPAVALEIHNEILTEENIPGIFANADIIAECFDRADMKALLTRVFFRQLAPQGKKLVAVSGLAGCGPANTIITQVVSPNFAVVGDGKTDVNEVPLLVASRVIIAAMHQAHQVIQWILATG
jgi:sulfur carrier protein ThiS adenylyltransferase